MMKPSAHIPRVRATALRVLRTPTTWWALFVIALVVFVPMLSYFLGDEPLLPAPPVPAEEPVSDAVAFTLGQPYAVAHRVDVAIGGEGVPVRPVHPEAYGPLMLVAVAPTQDGGVWVLDVVDGAESPLRVRRFTPDGEVRVAFAIEENAALVTPSPDDGLWVGFAAGPDGREPVRLYGPDGALLETRYLAAGMTARSLTAGPDGEPWAQLEEYRIVDGEGRSAYGSTLVPVPSAQQAAPDTDPLAGAYPGSFFGANGLRYVIESEEIPAAGRFVFPASTVTAYDGERAVAEIAVSEGLRPFAADGEGHVWCQPFPPRTPVQPLGRQSLGEPIAEVVNLVAFGEDGVHARLPVQQTYYLNEFAPMLWLTETGVSVLLTGPGAVSALFLEPSGPVSAAESAEVALDPAGLLLIAATEPLAADPYRTSDEAQRDMFRMVYRGLVEYDAELEPYGALAAEVPSRENGGVSEDGLTISYRMRPGSMWQDGTPVTAADVVATWEYLARTHPALTARFPGFERIADVVAEEDAAIVTLSEPFGPGPEAFFPFVLPAHLLERDGYSMTGPMWAEPVGTGPYRLVAWDAGSRWRLAAAAAQEAGEDEPRTSAIGRIDVVFADEEDALEAFQGARGPAVWLWASERLLFEVTRDMFGEIETVPTGRWRGVVFNADDPVTGDAAVRAAVRMVHPYARMFGTVLPEPPDGGLYVTPYTNGEPVAVPTGRSPQIEAARELLEEAGWVDRDGDGVRERDGIELVVEYSTTQRVGGDEMSDEEAELLKEVWTAIGIRPQQAYDTPFHYSSWPRNGYLSTGRFQYGVAVFPALPDPGWGGLFDPAERPGPEMPWGRAVTLIDDPLLARIHAEARAEYDPAIRAAFAEEVLDRVEDLGLMLPVRPEERALVTFGAIEGFAPAPFPAGTLHNVAEWRLGGAEGAQ